MTAKERYNWEPVKISKDINSLFNHLDNLDCYDWLEEADNEKVELKYYTDFSFDGERTFVFYSVWFSG